MSSVIKNINDKDKIVQIEFNSSQYKEEVALRYEILRKPLGLEFTKEQLAAESEWIHLGYFHDDSLIGCLVLVPEDDERIKMKQVTVASGWQGKGIGSQLVQSAEEYAEQKHFSLMYCHARDTAVLFYEKLGYSKAGDMFIEVSLPHFEMEKHLNCSEE